MIKFIKNISNILIVLFLANSINSIEKLLPEANNGINFETFFPLPYYSSPINHNSLLMGKFYSLLHKIRQDTMPFHNKSFQNLDNLCNQTKDSHCSNKLYNCYTAITNIVIYYDGLLKKNKPIECNISSKSKKLLFYIPGLSHLPDIITYFKNTINNDVKNALDWFHKIFSLECTEEVYAAYKEKTNKTKSMMKIERTENGAQLFITNEPLIHKSKALDPFYTLKLACTTNTIPLILLDAMLGFLDLQSIENRQKEEIIGETYNNILQKNVITISMIFNKHILKISDFVLTQYIEYLFNEKKKINLTELINKLHSDNILPKYTLGNALKYTIPNSKHVLTQKIINWIQITNFFLNCPEVILYHSNLKELDSLNIQLYNKSPFNNINLTFPPLPKRILPSEHNILSSVAPTLLFLLHFPHDFGHSIRENLMKHLSFLYNSKETSFFPTIMPNDPIF